MKSWTRPLLIGFILCSISAPLAAEGTKLLSDQSIADHIEAELNFDTAVLSTNVDVTSNDGVVTLNGTVDNLLASERATKLTRSVKGVRSVVNRIEVRPAISRTDRELKDDVQAALTLDPARVYLSSVASYQQ